MKWDCSTYSVYVAIATRDHAVRQVLQVCKLSMIQINLLGRTGLLVIPFMIHHGIAFSLVNLFSGVNKTM